MLRLKDEVEKRVHNYDYIFLIDNDAFIYDVGSVKRLLGETILRNLDVATHLVEPERSRDLHDSEKATSLVVPIPDQKAETCEAYPGVIPNPHLENSFTVIRTSLWRKLPRDTFGHSRKWYCRMVNEGASFGSHRTEYRLKYSHAGEGWFHLGNLMAYMYAIENKQWEKFHADSEMDMARLGFLITCNQRYVDHWPAEFQHSITAAVHKCGKDKALEAWDRLTKGTCMEGWT